MHTVPPRWLRRTRLRSSRAGFSLVEVSLAIGIVAFAFVALIGLLPTGLSVYRSSIDTSNETWIMQDLNSMMQVTDWDGVKRLTTENTVFYYDEEGKMTDWSSDSVPASSEPEVKNRRLYAVKPLIDDASRPGDDSGVKMREVYRVVLVFAPYINKRAMSEFEGLKNVDQVSQIKKSSELHTRSFWVAKMDRTKGI